MPTNNDIVATLEDTRVIEATLYPSQGIRTELDTVYLYNPDIAGIKEVTHDETLEGEGTTAVPLKVSTELLEEIHNASRTFVFEFDASQSAWVITHNLRKNPTITVVDSANTVVTCEEEYINENSVRISFNAPFKGKAYLN